MYLEYVLAALHGTNERLRNRHANDSAASNVGQMANGCPSSKQAVVWRLIGRLRLQLRF